MAKEKEISDRAIKAYVPESEVMGVEDGTNEG